MQYVYIIENTRGRLYIGETSNIEQRLDSHNRTAGPDWTQGKGPWKLIYFESFKNRTLALKRERYLKSLKAGQRIKDLLHIPRHMRS